MSHPHDYNLTNQNSRKLTWSGFWQIFYCTVFYILFHPILSRTMSTKIYIYLTVMKFKSINLKISGLAIKLCYPWLFIEWNWPFQVLKKKQYEIWNTENVKKLKIPEKIIYLFTSCWEGSVNKKISLTGTEGFRGGPWNHPLKAILFLSEVKTSETCKIWRF